MRTSTACCPVLGAEGGGEGGEEGLEDQREDPRGGFKGQSSVPAWPEAQSPYLFQELQVLPSTEHAKPGWRLSVGQWDSEPPEGEEGPRRAGLQCQGELECAACLKRAYHLLGSRLTGP